MIRQSHNEPTTTNAMQNDLMQSELDGMEGRGAGNYRVRPIAWTVQKSPRDDSQSTAIRIAYSIVARWDAESEQWVDWPQGWFVYGQHWIVKRNGQLNESAVRMLRESGVWNGDFSALEDDPPQNVTAIATVAENVYEGNVSYRVDWVDANADAPRTRGGFKPADPELLASLRARFQSQVRAIGGGSPQGTPPAPPASGPAPTTGGPGKEDVPF